MRQSGENKRKLMASLVAGFFAIQQTTLPLGVFASDITGVTPTSSGGVNTFNIDPTTVGNQVGFRDYTNFILDNGDIANLNFTGNMTTFVNTVSGTAAINGVLNSMKSNNFYNGKVVFIAPNGLTVGASGVLNVGSLGVYGSNSQPVAKTDEAYAFWEESASNPSANPAGTAPITINGKVLSRGDVVIKGAGVNVGANGAIVGGYAGATGQITSESVAAELFNTLVNTDNIKVDNAYGTTGNGNLVIQSTGGIDIQGGVLNYAKGADSQTNIRNWRPDDGSNNNYIIGSGAKIANSNGTTMLQNNNGNFVVAGNVKNTGENTTVANVQFKNPTSEGKMTVSGNIEANGKLLVRNDGTKGLDVTGTIKNNGTGKTEVINGYSDGYDDLHNTNPTNYPEKRDIGKMTVSGNIITNGDLRVENKEEGSEGMFITGNINSKGATEINNFGAGGLNIQNNAIVYSQGNLKVYNDGRDGLNVSTAKTISTDAALNFENTVNGTAGMNITNGTISSKGASTYLNNGAGGLNTSGSSKLQSDTTLDMTNTGTEGLNIDSLVNSTGKMTITNSGQKGLKVKTNGVVTSTGGLDMTNEAGGTGGLTVDGNVTNTGAANILNKAGNLTVNNKVTNNNGKLTVTNNGLGLYVNADAQVLNNGTGETLLENTGADGLNVTGKVRGDKKVTLTNSGAKGLNVKGNGNVTGENVFLTNTGAQGILVDSNARVTASNDLNISNTVSTQGADGTEVGKVNIKGLVKATNNDVNITSTGGDVIIGDNTTNDNYVTAGRNIKITTNKASVYNYAGEHGTTIPHSNLAAAKVLLNAGGDLEINATDGRIGREVGDGCMGGYCSGISNNTNTRDFAKSINGKVDGKVNLTTTKATTTPDYVINYAAMDSDMNIDHIKADGRVILTADYNRADGTTRYSLKNVATDPTKANVEGYGISMIASKDIGEKDNKLTFNQTKAGTFKTGAGGYGMDALANENIYIKGLDDQYTTNNVCSMIAREGEIDAEFSGNTYIREVTSEKDLKLVTRGKTMEIDYLGTVPNTPVDYFGPRDQGLIADNNNFEGTGYTGAGETDAIPNNAYVKALDINHNIRPNEAMIENPQAGTGLYDAYANSTAIVHNARLDHGDLEIAADNIYANGIEAHFNKDGFTKAKNPLTNKVQGEKDYALGKAVRPTDIPEDRDVHERNYYYPAGDGDFKGEDDDHFSDKPKTEFDPDDDIAEITPLDIETRVDKGIIPPPPPPPPGPDPDPDNPSYTNPNVVLVQRKIDEQDLDNIDKRQFIRFSIADNANPVEMESNSVELLDISRGGVALKHDNTLKTGDVIPVHIQYADLDIKADVKVVTSTDSRAGATFVNLNKATANKLLYLNILLEGPQKNVSYKN